MYYTQYITDWYMLLYSNYSTNWGTAETVKFDKGAA